MNKKAFGLLAASCALLLAVAQPSHAQTITQNQTGTHNGFFYSYFRSGGSATMTLGSTSNYDVTWSSVGDLVCGTGWNPGSQSRVINYNCGIYQNSGGGSQGVYGWSTNPLVEYYVQDNGNSTAGTFEGSVSSDGGTYNVWHHQQQQQPSILGTQTFWQNIDARTSGRGTGHNVSVTFQNHANFWNSHGMNLGTMNYQIVFVESFGGSGHCNQTCW